MCLKYNNNTFKCLLFAISLVSSSLRAKKPLPLHAVIIASNYYISYEFHALKKRVYENSFLAGQYSALTKMTNKCFIMRCCNNKAN